MIEKVTRKNKVEFEKILKQFWSDATLEDCKSDAKKTAQFMYKLDDKYVGFLTCSIRTEYVAGCEGKKVGYLDGIYVLDEYRHKGIATKLLNYFENWAKSKGLKEIASDLEIDNIVSLQFHQKMGFEVVEKSIHLKKNI